MPSSANGLRRPGVHVTRHRVEVGVEVLDGLRLAPAPEVLLACARHLTILDLVPMLDGALHTGDCRLETVARLAATRRPGAPRLRQALQLADGRSESAWESLLRLLHVCGRIRVEPQYDVAVDDVFVARGDLRVAGTRVLQEYDGGHHLERAQQRLDLGRVRRIVKAGWTRHGYTREDLLRDPASVLGPAYEALGRPPEPDLTEGLRRWRSLLAASLLTAAGKRRLRQRLGIDESGRCVRPRRPGAETQ